MPQRDATCGNCRHFERWGDDGEEGSCRRYPRVPIVLVWPNEMQIMHKLPEMQDYEWCGEHEPKEEVAE